MARTRFKQHRLAARQRFLLKSFHDRARAHGLFGEQVRGAQQHADANTLLGQRSRHGRHHRRRARVVNAAGEHHAQFRRRDALADFVEQHLDHGVPQDEARPGADMPAAFAPFENESARAILEEHAQ